MALSDTAIREAKAGDKARRLFDGGGLYLELAPSGGKWWRLKYRFEGKEKRLSLGVYPDVSLKDARERRDEKRKLLANEIGPGEFRKSKKAATDERNANSVEIVAREWFVKHTPNWSANHSDRTTSRLERGSGQLSPRSPAPSPQEDHAAAPRHLWEESGRYCRVEHERARPEACWPATGSAPRHCCEPVLQTPRLVIFSA